MPAHDQLHAAPLAVALRDAAHGLAAKRSIRDLDRTLSEIVLAAVDTVPHTDAGGISWVVKGVVSFRNPTNDTVTALDRLQAERREGPCVAAIEEPEADGAVLAHDLAGADAERFPRFAPHAVDAGYRSILSTQLVAIGGTRAALNLYATAPNVYDDQARQIAALFGAQAGLLLYGSEQASNLMHAVETRDHIGQAKGILMERFTVDEDEAFQMLVRSSQETNVKLVDVARWLQTDIRDQRRTPVARTTLSVATSSEPHSTRRRLRRERRCS